MASNTKDRNRFDDLQIKSWIRAGEHFEARSDGEGLTLSWPVGRSEPVWKLRYRFGGQARVLTIGTYSGFPLAEARKACKKLRARVSLGEDVALSKTRHKREQLAEAEAARRARTVGQVVAEFQDVLDNKLKHPEIPRRRFAKDVIPHIGRMPIQAVRPSDVADILRAVEKRDAPTISNDVLRWLKRLFTFALKREYVEVNPASGYDLNDAGGRERSRDRFLTRDELRTLFSAMRTAKGFSRQNELTVKLLLALAVRTGELREARWREFDLDAGIWRLPRERTKTDKALEIPLVPAVVEWLRELHVLACGSDYVLPARKMQHRGLPWIHEGTISTALGKIRHGLPPFTVHDLRRTARTHMGALGVPPHVCERVLNHKLRGVAGVYDVHDYFSERLAAMTLWTDLLLALDAGKDLNVVPLRNRSAA